MGVLRTASLEEIRRSFRDLARRYHPDVADNKTYAEEIFKRINEAYEVLSDQNKRRIYDRDFFRRTGPLPPISPFTRPPAPGTGPVDPVRRPDFVRNPFDVPPPRPNFRAAPQEQESFTEARPDLNIDANLTITLEDAIQGAAYIINVQHHEAAEGAEPLHTCRVRVPAGVYEGQRLRLKRLGYLDPRTFGVGDLHLTILYAPHKSFKVLGTSLYTDMFITPWEAALGTRLQVPTLDGITELQIPPGVQSGGYWRIARQGVPKKSGIRGDLIVRLSLRIPLVSTERERKLWRELAELRQTG